jgi:hypothetical protein
MDIIGTDGKPLKREEPKAEPQAEAKAPEKAPEPPAEKPAVPAVTCEIDSVTGVMTLRADLKWLAESNSAKEYFAFMGFMEQKRNEAAAIIQAMREQMAQQKAHLLKVKNKGLFNGFLNKIRRR